MNCFLCATVGGMMRPETTLDLQDLVVACYLMGRSIGGLPDELRDKAETMVCSDHDARIRKTIDDAVRLGAGRPEFEVMKPSLLRSAPPRLKQVK